MPSEQQFKVVRRIPQITGVPGAILYLTEVFAGPFESQVAAQHWIDINRPLGIRLKVEPIVMEPDEVSGSQSNK